MVTSVHSEKQLVNHSQHITSGWPTVTCKLLLRHPLHGHLNNWSPAKRDSAVFRQRLTHNHNQKHQRNTNKYDELKNIIFTSSTEDRSLSVSMTNHVSIMKYKLEETGRKL